MRFRILNLFIFLPTLFVLQGCSQNINGDVFELRADGSSKKLASVDVYAIPLKSVAAFERIANTKRDKKKAEVLASFASLSFDLKAFHEEHLAVEQAQTEIFIQDIKKGYIYSKPPVTKREEDLNQKMIDKFMKFDVESLYKKMNSLNPIYFYSQEIKKYITDTTTQKTVTDSEGKFNLNLSFDEAVIVALTKDNYGTNRLWLVRLEPNAKRITLSDANSFEKGCPTCLLSDIDNTLTAREKLSTAAYEISQFPKEKYKHRHRENRESLFKFAKEADLI